MNKGNAPEENGSVVKATVTKLKVVAFICIPDAHRRRWEGRRMDRQTKTNTHQKELLVQVLNPPFQINFLTFI